MGRDQVQQTGNDNLVIVHLGRDNDAANDNIDNKEVFAEY